ncbi:hypothetical protein Taro_011593 [Colocasia esculenta]|uniref:Uncharacterized protein n=1 Tax=Colocasia esculenta TaxID=4460 RepID=A0A843U1U4_COLES|nr:hypothetical protein [Colocasia esculenta]
MVDEYVPSSFAMSKGRCCRIFSLCRLSRLPTHQFSRTLPTQQAADSPVQQDPADSVVCRLSSLADSTACRLMSQQGSANSFELVICRLTSSAVCRLISSAGPCRLSSLPTQQPGRLSSLPTHVAASLPTHKFSRTLPTQQSVDSAACRLMLQQGSANSFELAVCRLTSSAGPCQLSSLPTQQPGRLSSLPTPVVASLLTHQFSSLPTHQFSRTLPTQQPGRLSSLPTHSADSPVQQNPANSVVCRLSILADSAACRLILQQGSANSFELVVCRLSSLSTHQFSRTLPTQQSADLTAWLTQQPADSCCSKLHFSTHFALLLDVSVLRP